MPPGWLHLWLIVWLMVSSCMIFPVSHAWSLRYPVIDRFDFYFRRLGGYQVRGELLEAFRGICQPEIGDFILADERPRGNWAASCSSARLHITLRPSLSATLQQNWFNAQGGQWDWNVATRKTLMLWNTGASIHVFWTCNCSRMLIYLANCSIDVFIINIIAKWLSLRYIGAKGK